VETENEIRTLTGEPATMDKCPYPVGATFHDPHVFIVLAYAPGQALQVLCQHCLLLSSMTLGPDPAPAGQQVN
jgi:hypothetical protein